MYKEEIFNLENITISIENRVSLYICLKVNKGDFIIIKRNNASGKSILLKLLYLKFLPENGSIFFRGKRLSVSSKKYVQKFRKRLGVILQNDFLIPFLNVFQNIEIACQIQKKTENITTRMNEIFSWLSLENIKYEKIKNLSDSQKQKVVIARALINNPSVIIADQPESFLDSESRKKIFFLFKSLNQLGSTIIMTTSELSEYDEKCRIISLDK